MRGLWGQILWPLSLSAVQAASNTYTSRKLKRKFLTCTSVMAPAHLRQVMEKHLPTPAQEGLACTWFPHLDWRRFSPFLTSSGVPIRNPYAAFRLLSASPPPKEIAMHPINSEPGPWTQRRAARAVWNRPRYAPHQAGQCDVPTCFSLPWWTCLLLSAALSQSTPISLFIFERVLLTLLGGGHSCMQSHCRSNKGFRVQQTRVQIPIHALPHPVTWTDTWKSLRFIFSSDS